MSPRRATPSAPKQQMTANAAQAGFERKLWETLDAVRGVVDAAEGERMINGSQAWRTPCSPTRAA